MQSLVAARDLGRDYTQYLHLITSVVLSLPGIPLSIFTCFPSPIFWSLAPWVTEASGFHSCSPEGCGAPTGQKSTNSQFFPLTVVVFSKLNSSLASAFGCFPKPLNSFLLLLFVFKSGFYNSHLQEESCDHSIPVPFLLIGFDSGKNLRRAGWGEVFV